MSSGTQSLYDGMAIALPEAVIKRLNFLRGNIVALNRLGLRGGQDGITDSVVASALVQRGLEELERYLKAPVADGTPKQADLFAAPEAENPLKTTIDLSKLAPEIVNYIAVAAAKQNMDLAAGVLASIEAWYEYISKDDVTR
ncbi:MAG: hypothetical protein WCX71_02560 [Candidatus Buchananbacteria bacterium]